jgi:hypothetical protein
VALGIVDFGHVTERLDSLFVLALVDEKLGGFTKSEDNVSEAEDQEGDST